jgi:hypothetical protein
MIINRVWAMPNKWTFQIPPIAELLSRYIGDGKDWLDPFSGNSKLTEHTNDINPKTKAQMHLDAVEYLKSKGDCSVAGVLFDPPYSPRQVAECYKNNGYQVNLMTTQSSFWAKLKREIARIVRPDGFVISCAWNSCGIGKKLGFYIVEILLVSHGGWHNDTIVTVERKIKTRLL